MDLKHPKIMGVINLTPDSFYKGSRHTQLDDIIGSASQMLSDGADILDIGGYSSRPGAADIPIQEEIKRIIKPIQEIKNSFPNAIISVDTFRSEVAARAVAVGADIINDISAGMLDDEMLYTVSQLKVPYIAMHMLGNPQTVKGLASYEDVTKEVIKYFSEVLNKTNQLGINDVLIDPGFGFAKTIEHNYQLLSNLELLGVLERPILVGLSRKSMIYKTLGVSQEEALNGTTALNTLALLKGVSVLRVHDIKEAKQIVKLLDKIDRH